MNNLKELLSLHEAADPSHESIPKDGPVDIKDVVKYFPKQGDKAIHAFARKGRLQFGGKTLYDADYEPGAGLNKAIKAAKDAIDDEEVEVRVGMAGSNEDFEFHSKVEDASEVWVGYDTESNELLIGFDCWTSEQDFNDAWDSQFEKNFDEEFNMDDYDHEKIFNKSRKEYIDGYSMVGMLVIVDSKYNARIEEMPGPNGFIRSIYKAIKSQRGVIQLS